MEQTILLQVKQTLDQQTNDPPENQKPSSEHSSLIDSTNDNQPTNNPSTNTTQQTNTTPASATTTATASAVKKFKASSLSVNKKFLSQSDPKLNKNHSPRLTSLSSASNPAIPSSAPRLLTGKIGLNHSILNASGSGASGWAKTPLAVAPSPILSNKSPELSHPTLQTNQYDSKNKDDHSQTGINGFLQALSTTTHQITPSSTPPATLSNSTPNPTPSSSTATNNNNNTNVNTSTNAVPATSAASATNAASSSSSSPWVKLTSSSTRSGMDKLSNDFPTAQEVAQHTKLKAQSMAAAVAARDKAVQDRAAASAAYNQQLLQTLDGFRGTHLDPNASHWDEMEDEDDMFGEVVEFGDGTQYKVTEVKPPAIDPLPPSSNGAPSTGNKLSTSRDVEQMPPFLRARAELKSLFNERIGKFEPYPGKLADKNKDEKPPHVQILQRGSGDLSTSPSASSTRLPDTTAKDGKSSTDINPARLVSPPDSSHRTNLSQPKHSLPPSAAPNSEIDNQTPDPTSNPSKEKKPDLDELHRTEMTSAAERARKRRQEEEAAREAEKERARLKAAEIEAKLKATADAANSAHKKSKPSDATEKSRPQDSNSWRSRAPPPPSESKQETSSAKIPKPDNEQPDSLAKKAVTSESTTGRSETKPLTRSSSQLHAATPLPSQETAFRSRTDVGTSSRSLVWKPKSLTSNPPSKLDNRPQQSNTKQLPETTSKPQGEYKSLIRPDSRQPAPHLLQEHVKTSTEQISSKDSAPSTRPQAPPVLKTSSEVWPFKPTSASAPSQSSPILSSSTNRLPAPEKNPGFKLPDMSHLDTVMSRIKVVLEADKEARSKAAAATPSSDSQSTTPEAAKLKVDQAAAPGKEGSDQKSKEALDTATSTQPTSSPSAVYVAGRPRTLLPRTVPETKPLAASPKSKESPKTISPTPELADASSTPPPKIPSTLNSSLAPSNPASKKPTTVRKAARFDVPPSPAPRPAPTPVRVNSLQQSLPKWVNRDPIVFFDATRQERPSSPVPAWKAFTVKFGSVKPKPRPASHLIKTFWNTFVPAKLNVLTWNPPMAHLSPKILSVDDLLFRKKYIQGALVSHVQLPKNTMSSLESKLLSGSSNDPSTRASHPKSALGNGSTKLKGRGATTQAEQKGRVPGRADETTSWRRPAVEKATVSVAPSTPVPSASSPIDASKESAQPAAGSKLNDNSATRRTKSKIPDGCKVAFQKPAHLSTSSNPSTTGMFMVNSEITGEEPGLSCPSDQPSISRPKPSTPNDASVQTSTPITPHSRNSPTLTPRSTNMTGMSGSKGSTSSWTKSPLAFSVLDSHTKNVWSQPDGQMTAKRAPSGKIENSLEGITDDFPASLPRTLNDFNAEEEPRNRSQPESSRSNIEIASGSNLEQNAGSSTNADLHSGTIVPDEQAKTNGLAVQPVYMNSPTAPPHYSNEHPSSNPMHMYPPHNYSSPPNFPVPPGYQLVPIGSMQTTQATQYPPISSIYPAQASAPWSPSLGPVQPNGYANSPQLYSPNTNYLPLATSSSVYPSHAHPVGPNQITDGSGFNRSPGPIAPRGGSRPSGHTGHMNRPSINEPNNFVPNVNRSHGSNFSPVTNKRQPNPNSSINAPYHLAPTTTPIVDASSSSELNPVGGGGYGTGDGNFGSPFHPSSILPINIHHPPQQQPPNSFNQVIHHGTGAEGQSPHMMNTGHVHHHHHQPSLIGPMPPPPPPPQHHYLPPTAHQFHPNNSNNPALQPQHGLVTANNGVNHLNPNRGGLIGEIGHVPPHHSHHPSLGYSNPPGVVSHHPHQHSRGNSTGGRANNNNNNPNLPPSSMNNNNVAATGGYNSLHHGNHSSIRGINTSNNLNTNGIHLSPTPPVNNHNHNPNLSLTINGLYNNPTRR